MCCPVAASYPLCLRQPSAPSFHQQLAGLGSGGGGCPWLYPLLPMCWCPRATSSPSEHRGALGEAPSAVSGMNEAARAKLGTAAWGQCQASTGWGQPGAREGRKCPQEM